MRLKTALRIAPKLWGANGYLRSAGYVFIVGHMRSYSSLLAHILGSHRQIVGYAEMHQKYRGALDLLELTDKVARSCDKAPAGRYVLDKILHPQPLSPRVMRRTDVKVILLARSPTPTLASILAIGAGGYGSLEDAIGYYVERLDTLLRVAELRDGDVLYLEAESILEETESTLRRVAGYLGVAPELSGEYSVFPLTGVPKFGDPSEWIRARRVVRQRATRPAVRLSAAQARRIADAYTSLRVRMKDCARIALVGGAAR